MDAPPLQYVKTRDSCDIAYTVAGDGDPFVIVPFIFNHVRPMWHLQAFRSLFEPLASRFSLIQYDARGMGDSQRGLTRRFEVRDYIEDLDAVMERLDPAPAILFAYAHACHAALLYAAHRPRRVRALVLGNPLGLETAFGQGLSVLELARSDWEGFLNTWVQFSGRPEFLESTRMAVNQADLTTVLEASVRSDVSGIIPSVQAPAVILASNPPPSPALADVARRLAASLPNSRLVHMEGVMGRDFLYADDGGEPAILKPIDAFVETLAPLVVESAGPPGEAPTLAGLSSREIEVLRLLAQGKSNPQIAQELFITRNTVQNHVSSILIKLNLQNRAQAAVYAKEHGLV